MKKRSVKQRLFSIAIALVLSISFGSTALAKSTPTREADTGVNVPMEDIQRFATAIALIKRYYIEPVKDKKLFDNAIRGMLLRLDPHSAYLDEDDMKDLKLATTGKFGGIGIEIIPERGLIRIVSPLDDTPAFHAGLKAGDMVVRINDKLVKSMSLREAVKLMRGKSGSKVELTVLRKGDRKPLKFSITREIINVKTVKSELLDGHYGYIRIAFFQAPTKKDLLKAINKLKRKSGNDLKGIIVDVRNNPGGLLDSAIEVADVFLDAPKLKHDKLIVYTKGHTNGSLVRAKATAGDSLKGIPIVVLINEGSASASEIVAGALQDHKRALVLGKTSFGKGSVQTVLPIDEKSAIKLTTALYYTPGGTSIQAKGIEPDVIIADLKLPKEKDDALLFDPLDETDLRGHIANGNKAGKTEVSSAQKKALAALARKDFALYEALNLLKGISAFHY